GHVESRGRDARAQRLHDRVAARDQLGVVGALGLGRALPARIRLPVPRPGRLEALLGGLALAGDVPAAVLGLGGGALALERFAPVAAGAGRGTLLGLARPRASRL